MKNEYEIERGVIEMMFEDKLLNDRVYNQLQDEVNRKENAEYFKWKLQFAFVFYLVLISYIYMTNPSIFSPNFKPFSSDIWTFSLTSPFPVT